MHWFAKYSNSLLQQQFLARPELKAHPSDRFDEICCSGDLVRVLHDRGAASRLSRVCLDFVQDERRVGRVEQVKSWDISPLCSCHVDFIGDEGRARQVDQLNLLGFAPLDVLSCGPWTRHWTSSGIG